MKKHLLKITVFIVNVALVGAASLYIKEKDKERLVQQREEAQKIENAAQDDLSQQTLEGVLEDQGSIEEATEVVQEKTETPAPAAEDPQPAQPANAAPTSVSGAQPAASNSSSSSSKSSSSSSSKKSSTKKSSNSSSSGSSSPSSSSGSSGGGTSSSSSSSSSSSKKTKTS